MNISGALFTSPIYTTSVAWLCASSMAANASFCAVVWSFLIGLVHSARVKREEENITEKGKRRKKNTLQDDPP